MKWPNEILDFNDSPFIEDLWFRSDLDSYFAEGSGTAENSNIHNIVFSFLYKTGASLARSRVYFLHKTNAAFNTKDTAVLFKTDKFNIKNTPIAYEHNGIKLPTMRITFKNFED